MYFLICLCISAIVHLQNAVFAEDLNFKIRPKYEDNDYSGEDRDIIEGFRTSFVPPKWERNTVSVKRKHQCDRIAAALVDYEGLYDEITEDEELAAVLATSTESTVYCGARGHDYEGAHDNDYEDVEEKEDYSQDKSTAKSTKKDYFVMGILMRGENICGKSTKITPAPTSVLQVINIEMATEVVTEVATTAAKHDAMAQEDQYDTENDDEHAGSIVDDTCKNTLDDNVGEMRKGPKIHCRREVPEEKDLDRSSTSSKKTEQAIGPKTAPPMEELNNYSKGTKIEPLMPTEIPPKMIPYSSCIIKEVDLDNPIDKIVLPEDSYMSIMITGDSEGGHKLKRLSAENVAKKELLKYRHMKAKQLARERRIRKRLQKQHGYKNRRVLYERYIDVPVAFKNDLNIPHSNQLVYESAINNSKVPTDSDDDTPKQTTSMKFRLHENFWLQNEDATHVRQIQAGNMKKYIDFNVNPCDDFFKYACGNWYKYNPIPDDRNNYDTFDLLRDSLDYILRDLLEDKEIDNAVNTGQRVWKGFHPVYKTKSRRNFVPDLYDADEDFYFLSSDHQPWDRSPETLGYSENTVEATTKAKYMYSACMNTELQQKRGIQPAMDLISKLGGWPILDQNWEPKDYEFEWLLAQLRLYNNDILLSEWVGPDVRNSMEYIIQIDQTTLGLPNRAYYLEPGNEAVLAAYQKYIVAIGLEMGANQSTIARDALDIVSFEIELAAITESSTVTRNVSEIYIRLTVNELRRLVPQFNWLRYFRLVSDNYVEADDEVVLYCMRYIRRLVELISRTNVRTTTNYLLWRFMRHRVNNLDDRFQLAKRRFHKIIYGREHQPPRWQTCVLQVNSNMGMAVGKLFVSKYYPKQSKDDTLRITKYIREAFADILRDTIWLDPITTDLALIKLAAMRLKIGYPNYILNRRKLNKRYSDVQVHPAYYFENTISLLQHLTRLEHIKVKRQVDKNVWNSAPAVVNAYYSRNKNQMIFPAGILQPPFYHRYFPKAMNFGGIGIVMGHEMTHGFDDKGRLFDKEGNLKNWWKDESIAEFHERTRCLIDQYNHYSIPEVNVQLDGVSTQGENIADNGGLKQAFLAYQYWLKENEDKIHSETLPGLNMTNLQLFFLNFAQIWCGDMRPEAALTNLPGALHSPGRFRVIGTLSNSEEFASVFNCKMPAPMNPDDKCNIW